MHPMAIGSRTAILVPGFEETRAVRVFGGGWTDRLARFQPASVAGPVEELRRLTQSGLRLEHAVIVFTYQGEGELSQVDRELFWRAFGVPVFEQVLDDSNRLVATECEAHAGLHVVTGSPAGDLDTEVCGCGNRTPRLSRGTRIRELVELLA